MNSELCYNIGYGGKGNPGRVHTNKIESIDSLIEEIERYNDVNYNLGLLYGNIRQTYEISELEKELLFMYIENIIKEIFIKIPLRYKIYKDTYSFLIIPDEKYRIIQISILLKCGIRMLSVYNTLWNISISIILDSINNIIKYNPSKTRDISNFNINIRKGYVCYSDNENL